MGIRTARRHAPSYLTRCRPLVFCCSAAGVAALACVAGCGASAPSVSLPPKQSGTPSATAPASAAPTSAKQAVIDAYMAFWPASSRAEKAGNATAAQAILSPFVAPDYISYMISGMQSAWAKDEVGWGASVEHIQSVIVATLNSGEQTAEVRDCQDDSHSGLANAQTGALVPDTLGSPEQELYTSLSLVNGHWLIDQVTFVGDSCTG
jgi:hypothetical protein